MKTKKKYREKRGGKEFFIIRETNAWGEKDTPQQAEDIVAC